MELGQGFLPYRRFLAGVMAGRGAVQRNHDKSRNFLEIQAVSPQFIFAGNAGLRRFRGSSRKTFLKVRPWLGLFVAETTPVL